MDETSAASSSASSATSGDINKDDNLDEVLLSVSSTYLRYGSNLRKGGFRLDKELAAASTDELSKIADIPAIAAATIIAAAKERGVAAMALQEKAKYEAAAAKLLLEMAEAEAEAAKAQAKQFKDTAEKAEPAASSTASAAPAAQADDSKHPEQDIWDFCTGGWMKRKGEKADKSPAHAIIAARRNVGKPKAEAVDKKEL